MFEGVNQGMLQVEWSGSATFTLSLVDWCTKCPLR